MSPLRLRTAGVAGILVAACGLIAGCDRFTAPSVEQRLAALEQRVALLERTPPPAAPPPPAALAPLAPRPALGLSDPRTGATEATPLEVQTAYVLTTAWKRPGPPLPPTTTEMPSAIVCQTAAEAVRAEAARSHPFGPGASVTTTCAPRS